MIPLPGPFDAHDCYLRLRERMREWVEAGCPRGGHPRLCEQARRAEPADRVVRREGAKDVRFAPAGPQAENLGPVGIRDLAGRQDDVAGLVQFLSSRAGSYLTGIVIPLDGGLTGCA